MQGLWRKVYSSDFRFQVSGLGFLVSSWASKFVIPTPLHSFKHVKQPPIVLVYRYVGKCNNHKRQPKAQTHIEC